MPAKAGTRDGAIVDRGPWVPAFAGMTECGVPASAIDEGILDLDKDRGEIRPDELQDPDDADRDHDGDQPVLDRHRATPIEKESGKSGGHGRLRNKINNSARQASESRAG